MRGTPGCISPRRALSLIEHLPDTSNFSAVARFSALARPAETPISAVDAVTWRDFRGWGGDRELLAQLSDRLQLLHVAFVSSKMKKGASPPQFKPLDRPGEKYKRATGMFNKLFNLGKRGG